MATGVARDMQRIFGDRIGVDILLNDSEEATGFPLKGATNVFLDGEWVPLETAVSRKRMETLLREVLGE